MLAPAAGAGAQLLLAVAASLSLLGPGLEVPPARAPPLLLGAGLEAPAGPAPTPRSPAAAAAAPRPPRGLDRGDVLRPCPSSADCVSTSAKEAVNKAMSPLLYSPTQRETSFARALSLLRSRGGYEVVDADAELGYLHAVVTPGGTGLVEDLEMLLPVRDGKASGVATFRDMARGKMPTPPWCLKKNCINGNQIQRERMSELAQELGWEPLDSLRMEDAKWTPIFLNEDRVPP